MSDAYQIHGLKTKARLQPGVQIQFQQIKQLARSHLKAMALSISKELFQTTLLIHT
jgi:hypothetical protein